MMADRPPRVPPGLATQLRGADDTARPLAALPTMTIGANATHRAEPAGGKDVTPIMGPPPRIDHIEQTCIHLPERGVRHIHGLRNLDAHEIVACASGPGESIMLNWDTTVLPALRELEVVGIGNAFVLGDPCLVAYITYDVNNRETDHIPDCLLEYGEVVRLKAPLWRT